VVRFESDLRSASGVAKVPAAISAAPIRDASKVVSGRLIVVTDLTHLNTANAGARISELEQKLEVLDRALAKSRAEEQQARGMFAKASALEARARTEADVSRRVESEIKARLERAEEERDQAQGSSRQLLEINRLKSEFIVNAGHDVEASLQSVLGLAELLERGSYGVLTREQREAVHGIYGWARRIKSDVDWLIEYGSTRSRRLETTTAD
jgi:signal transduction histidine kinase